MLSGSRFISGPICASSYVSRHSVNLSSGVLLVIAEHVGGVIQLMGHPVLPDGLLSVASMVRAGIITAIIIVLVSLIVPVFASCLACCLSGNKVLKFSNPLL